MSMDIENAENEKQDASPLKEGSRLFDSFWLGGFESACQINTLGERINMLAATQHDLRAEEDYQRCAALGIRAVRDGICWPFVEETPGFYNWRTFVPMLRAAQRTGVQVVWNLLHYGWPLDIDILSGAFVDRFARFSAAAARVVRNETEKAPIYVPVNEISFLAWAIGHKGIIQPCRIGLAMEVKKQLVRAALAAMEAIRAVDARARFAHVEPVIHVIPPRDRPELAEQAAGQRNAQFDAWDMICGRLHPELGGTLQYLDIVGVNYYHSNQFESPDVRLRWEDEPRDDRFVPFHRLLDEVQRRYGTPIFVAETSHFGAGRARWMTEMAEEIYIARLQGIPVEGVCLYPIIDRPDWENMNHWHNSGLWDMQFDTSGQLQRVINEEYLRAFAWAKNVLAELGCV